MSAAAKKRPTVGVLPTTEIVHQDATNKTEPSKMKKDELKALCKEHNIKGMTGKSKEELIKVLTPVLAPKIEADTEVKAEPVEMNTPVTINYPNLEALDTLCKGFIGEKIVLTATFKGRSLPIMNPNLVGDLLEDIFYPFYKEVCPDFEEGPKQESPDFFGHEREFQFEQKAFYGSPGFDISNFTSLIHQISKPGGLIKKIFKTKYLVYEYGIEESAFVIKNFWMLNIWNLPTYHNLYPISMQVKKSVWYNIRPGTKAGWMDSSKTPHVFLDSLLQCIDRCSHLEDKQALKTSILTQMEEAKLRGFL